MSDYEKIAEALNYPTDGILDVIIDSDAYNEVDDQVAIAWALCSPERINVKAVYAAPYASGTYLKKNMPAGTSDEVIKSFTEMVGGKYSETAAEGMEKSYNEIIRIFDLLGIPPEGRVFHGARQYMDGKPVDSPAVKNLIAQAMAMPKGKRLYVLAIAAITNVASAILMEPAIKDKIVVVWLGGHAPFLYDGNEFNMASDVTASQAVLDSGVPLVLLPCSGVVDRLAITREETEVNLVGKGKTADYLGTIIQSGINTSPEFVAMLSSMGSGSLNDIPREIRQGFPVRRSAGTHVIWDISTVGYVLNPNFVVSSLTPAPILNNDLTWSHNISRHPIRLCYSVNRDYMFGDLFAKLNGK